MEEVKTINQEIGEPKFDTLRFGLQSVKGEIVGSHPLESAYNTAKVRQQQTKRQILANAYGSAFPLKMEFDRQILSKRFQRPPGAIPSSYLGLEAMTGALEDFGFEDYLNDPRDSENFCPADMHHGMEMSLEFLTYYVEQLDSDLNMTSVVSLARSTKASPATNPNFGKPISPNQPHIYSTAVKWDSQDRLDLDNIISFS
ncbi:hypothetical protein ACH5RR_011346 [Cinchona calisaya]|uniref:Proteasome maturation factor UMP1 n=1 Tax=Cinchona calisaya TaxID=153742 RepID=A0ABD3A826_9GENT